MRGESGGARPGGDGGAKGTGTRPERCAPRPQRPPGVASGGGPELGGAETFPKCWGWAREEGKNGSVGGGPGCCAVWGGTV